MRGPCALKPCSGRGRLEWIWNEKVRTQRATYTRASDAIDFGRSSMSAGEARQSSRQGKTSLRRVSEYTSPGDSPVRMWPYYAMRSRVDGPRYGRI